MENPVLPKIFVPACLASWLKGKTAAYSAAVSGIFKFYAARFSVSAASISSITCAAGIRVGVL